MDNKENLKPSECTDRFWIRARKKITFRNNISPWVRIVKFFKDKGYDFPCTIIENGKPIISDGNTGAALQLNEELIDELAVEINILTGKWLIHIENEKVDELWNTIKELVNNDKLYNAKVSTIAHPWKKEKAHVICVYTKNYLDKDDVIKARDELEKIGITSRITYKPDIYTHLGIYKDNKERFGLKKATRYYL